MEKEHDQTECLEFEIKIVWRGHHHLGLCWKFSSFCRKCMFKNRIKNNWLFPCCLKFLPHVLLLITIHYLPLTIVTCFFHVTQAASSEGRHDTSMYPSNAWHHPLLSLTVNDYSHFYSFTQKPSVTLHCP